MRIYHLDLKISMYQTTWLKRFFQRLKESGYDGIMVEVDNKLIYPSLPEIAAPDALSSSQWRDLCRFTKDLGLIIYPFVQTLGHMQHVLQPRSPLRRFAESPNNPYQLCPSKPGSLKLMQGLIKDAWEAFDRPGRLHLGGDECRGVGVCPRCRGRDLAEILMRYMDQLQKTAANLGATTEFWADMVLAHPAALEGLSKDIRFVDWMYDRVSRYSPNVLHFRGYGQYRRKPVAHLLESLPAKMEALRPYITGDDNLFDTFYGTRFLKAQGYEVVLCSGVRSSGDCYSLPRTRQTIENVGVTQEMADELNCDHIITSWAVRLSHPETTWPGLLSYSTDTSDSALAVLGASIGGLDSSLLESLVSIQDPIIGIDLLLEAEMRFERPFYGSWLEHVERIMQESDQQQSLVKIAQRAADATKLKDMLEQRLTAGLGEPEILRHWIIALELISLRSRQVLAVAKPDSENLENKLNKLIEENRELALNFSDLWSQSLTPHSLTEELEIKFNRDIRVLNEINPSGF